MCCSLLFGDSRFLFLKNLMFDWDHGRAWKPAPRSTVALVWAQGSSSFLWEAVRTVTKGEGMKGLGETLLPHPGEEGHRSLGLPAPGRPWKPPVGLEIALDSYLLSIYSVLVSVLVALLGLVHLTGTTTLCGSIFHSPHLTGEESWDTEQVSCRARIRTQANILFLIALFIREKILTQPKYQKLQYCLNNL